MVKSPDTLGFREKVYRYGLPLFLAPAILFYLRDSSDPQKVWANSVDNVQQGTIPEPTPTPETEQTEPILAFSTEVRAYDENDNQTSGVVVAFVSSPEDQNLSLFDENLDLNQWSVGITPIQTTSGITQEHQFSPSNRDGFVAGAIATDHWTSLIAKAEAEGDQETADYLRNNYPPLQPLQKLHVTSMSAYANQGEAPMEIGIRLVTNEEGQHTAIMEQKNPSYMQQDSSGELTVAGEKYGLVQPISTTVVPGESINVLFDVTQATPKITVISNGEQIIVEPVLALSESVSVAGSESIVIEDLNNLGITFNDTLIEQKNAWFELQESAVNSISTASASEVAPIELPENDRRLAITIDGSAKINQNGLYKALFIASNKQSYEVTAQNILPTDIFRISIVDNQIVVTDMSNTNHLPDIFINGVRYSPNEPHPIDQEPVDQFDHKLFAPSITHQ